MKTNKAFSLVEILVALIIVSLIMAALAPVITKKLSSAGITIGGGGGGSGEPEIELECSDIDPNCVACADDKCVKCETGYKVTSEGLCESDGPNYVMRAPSRQEDCDPYKAHYFQGTCITKKNAGDTDGAPIDGVEGIEIKDVGTKCTTDSCCWEGVTASNYSTFTINSTYSGGTRTLCSWEAAKAACEAYDINDTKGKWHLPTADQLSVWIAKNNNNDYSSSLSLLTKYLGRDGLDLCDDREYYPDLYGAPICQYYYQACPTASSNEAHCYPYQVWATTPGVAITTTTTTIVSLSSGTMSTSTARKYDGGRSSRCVLKLVKKITLPTERQKAMAGARPSSQADCDKYNAIYLSNNQTCITKGNAGDIDKGGGPLSTNGTGTINARTDLGIYIIKPGTTCTTNYCCWSAAATSGECTTYSKVGSYDGCTRTVCDWYAAKAACDNYDIEGTYGLWELPTHADFQVWKSVIESETSTNAKLSRYLGPDGLDLCDNSEYYANDYGAGKCEYKYQACPTASSNEAHCYPYQVWGAATDPAIEAKEAYQAGLTSGSLSLNTSTKKYDGGRSVRCVLRYLPDS